jgi:hypothetical protein
MTIEKPDHTTSSEYLYLYNAYREFEDKNKLLRSVLGEISSVLSTYIEGSPELDPDTVALLKEVSTCAEEVLAKTLDKKYALQFRDKILKYEDV